jgi:hypothetical protein
MLIYWAHSYLFGNPLLLIIGLSNAGTKGFEEAMVSWGVHLEG